MRNDARLLVIADRPMVEAIGRALPSCDIVPADNPLAGIWQAGQGRFDGVLISYSAGRDGNSGALRNLRGLAPDARIVLACAPADEPAARRAVQNGADDYVLEPLSRDDIEAAFQLPSVRLDRIESAAPAGPSVHEIQGLGEIMKDLSQGPQRSAFPTVPSTGLGQSRQMPRRRRTSHPQVKGSSTRPPTSVRMWTGCLRRQKRQARTIRSAVMRLSFGAVSPQFSGSSPD